MAKRPPKRYHPGELEKTRNRLGPLSREEAEELARRLGGDVGVEQDRPEVEEGYQKLKDPFYQGKMIRPSDGGKRMGIGGAGGGWTNYGYGSGLKIEAPDRSYAQRLNLWFFASKPEFEIIKRSRAWLALWPFIKPAELIHPSFIMKSGDIFYRHIETFVLALRGLLRKVEKNRIHQLRNTLYRQIAESIKDWEIEAMHRELTRLQTHPRMVESRDMGTTLFYLYRPFILLSNLDPATIQRAIRHLFDLSILELPKKNLEADRLRRYFIAASEETDYLFASLPLRCYPLLLLLFSREVLSYRELLEREEAAILNFFRIEADDIVQPPKPKAISSSEEALEDQKENQESEESDLQEEKEGDEEGEEDSEGNEAPESLEGTGPGTISYRRSLFMLEQLFPGSGWISLDEGPDLLPYFEPILKLPQGSGMIPPGDPLQYVVILTAIIADLFYGFRDVDPGTVLDREGNPIAAKETFEAIGGQWHTFLDELLEKHYLGTLRDYCRNIEHSYDFVFSDYGKRMEADLLFLRQRFFFPNLQLQVPKYLQPRKLPSLTKYYRTVEELKGLLEQMNGGDGWGIKNRGTHFSFPVENSLSKRLTSLLDFEGKGKTMLALSRYTLAAVIVLDHLLQREEQLPNPLYRHVEQREDLPVYSVTSLNTSRLLQRFEQKRKEATIDPSELTGDYDHATGLGGFELAGKEIEKSMYQSLSGLAILRIKSDAEGGKAIIADAKEIEGELRLFQDQLFRIQGAEFLILLPEFGREEAEEKARSIASTLRRPGRRGPIISVLSYNAGLNYNARERGEVKLLRESENSLPSGELPEHPAIYYWDREKQEMRDVTDKPLAP